MADFYVAPSYRGYSILRGPYTKDRKEYAIIDFKGKEKEVYDAGCSFFLD